MLVSDSGLVGGAETFLGYLSGALPAEVHLTAMCEPAVADVIRRARAGAEVLPRPRRLPSAISGIRAAAPDVVHVNATHPRSCRREIYACHVLGVPFVLVDHSVYLRLTRLGLLTQHVLSRWASARVAVGRRSARQMDRICRVPKGTFQPILNGVPPLPALPPRPRDGRLVLGYLGRLEPEKGLDLLLDALAVARNPIDLAVAGTGTQSEPLAAQVARLGLGERVALLGRRRPQDLLGNVDVLVLPSRTESLPLAMLEAMFSGRPVLAADVGSVGDVIRHGVTGWLVPAGDPAALARVLDDLAADRDSVLRAGAAAREAAQSSASDLVMAGNYDDLYRSVLSPGDTRARR